MIGFALNTLAATAPIAAGIPERMALAQRLMILLAVAVVVLFLGWIIARWLRLRHIRLTAETPPGTNLSDAWSESAGRIEADPDDDATDPGGSPDTDPDPRWQV
ncbi:hypothetical protein MNBD_PLANCTO03-1897 [hydrothermal vent metagenome]|uniref:Uncharacterized protein n=1 Tax=hydrothermal vent metagenome TaxID=652676 RepID=A0A3B1DVQ6_9ZZZZ